MRLKWIICYLGFLLLNLVIPGESAGDGVDYEANTLRSFFGTRFGTYGNRPPPRHDTPSSPCSCSCGERNDAKRIVGGHATAMNEFPWMVRLSYFNRFYCGGMLINDRYVLTAMTTNIAIHI
ncbi:melanization protease 1-like [Agrilus planipennis]|uniref:Melanization protease 1-like n=1 Tax=Agrilus planipennis TaxID=224129 RepID=A0A7F5RDJ1_AGRPL|nr:melanization protease 1-like [Agrilus planipennis]